MEPMDAVTMPHLDRAGEGHPVMHNPRNEARAAFFKKYKKHAPQGWPYTEDEVAEANQLLDLHEDGGVADTDDLAPHDQPPGMDPQMGAMMSKLMMRRLG